LAPNTIYSAASTAVNLSVTVQASTPEYAEAFVNVSLFTAGNVARFTVVSRDAYGNKVIDPALTSSFLLLSQSGGDAVLPVARSSNEAHYLIPSKGFQPHTYVFGSHVLQKKAFTSWTTPEYRRHIIKSPTFHFLLKL
jgi:hypothetical protein